MSIEKKTEGFGSAIEKVTKLIGLDKAAEQIAHAIGYKDCGCGARKEALDNPDLLINKVFFKNNNNNEDIKEQDS
jgi:hypothetical protein